MPSVEEVVCRMSEGIRAERLDKYINDWITI